MTPSEAISALLAAEFTEVAIGEVVGARQSTINRIKTGAMQPNYTLGKALVDFAERVADSSRHVEAANGDAAGSQVPPLKAA